MRNIIIKYGRNKRMKIKKIVKPFGNSGHIVVSKSLIGEEVEVLYKKKKKESKKKKNE